MIIKKSINNRIHRSAAKSVTAAEYAVHCHRDSRRFERVAQIYALFIRHYVVYVAVDYQKRR